jgi:hypothetical protein
MTSQAKTGPPWASLLIPLSGLHGLYRARHVADRKVCKEGLIAALDGNSSYR